MQTFSECPSASSRKPAHISVLVNWALPTFFQMLWLVPCNFLRIFTFSTNHRDSIIRVLAPVIESTKFVWWCTFVSRFILVQCDVSSPLIRYNKCSWRILILNDCGKSFPIVTLMNWHPWLWLFLFLHLSHQMEAPPPINFCLGANHMVVGS